MYMTDLYPDVVPQTAESSPPRKSNRGRDIEYAPSLLPNGGGLAPPVIGYHAPRTSSLLQGQMREPADVGRKRKTKTSAIDPSALAPKKKTKKDKPKPADDLPALDPSIEQALDEEEIGEDKKKTAVKKKSAAAPPKPAPPPPPPPSPHVQQMSSDRTPSATGSHHVEEEEQPAAPAIPVLADLFSFDIQDYFDETEEETTSKALAPLDETVKKTLEDISLRLESSLDNLVAGCGSIRAQFAKIQALIPDDLANTITPAVYLEQHQLKPLSKPIGKLCMKKKPSLINSLLGQSNRTDLIAQLEECSAKLDLEMQKLANLPSAVEEHKSRLRSAIKNVADMTKSLKVISGTDAQDIQAIEEVDQIRQRAMSAIQRYLSG
uniref:DUF1409 domain-containing protein n=2 Tax=Oryza sativa subsp. japonica TaxID=39947 RepID=Q7G321_ORYSJ|nr:Hypothetical protein [Oryza sativa Japonica Group]AAP53486.1 hypothetical protein LOC_Os10g24320 [Oryza sativa Japonica Group]